MPVAGSAQRRGDDGEIVARRPACRCRRARSGRGAPPAACFRGSPPSDCCRRRADRRRARCRARGRSRSARGRPAARASVRSRTPEHDLNCGIILLGKRAQVLVEARLRAVQRLQHRDRRPVAGRAHRPAGEAQCGQHGGADIGPGHDPDQHDASAELIARPPNRGRRPDPQPHLRLRSRPGLPTMPAARRVPPCRSAKLPDLFVSIAASPSAAFAAPPASCWLPCSAACATPPADPAERAAFEQNNDPLEPLNRQILDFNLFLDRILLKPVTKVYIADCAGRRARRAAPGARQHEGAGRRHQQRAAGRAGARRHHGRAVRRQQHPRARRACSMSPSIGGSKSRPAISGRRCSSGACRRDPI